MYLNSAPDTSDDMAPSVPSCLAFALAHFCGWQEALFTTLGPSYSALRSGPPNLKIHNGEEQPAVEMTTLASALTVRFFLPFLPCFLLLLRVGLEQATAHV